MNTRVNLNYICVALTCVLFLTVLSGCGPKEKTAEASGLIKVSVQTDWYAQAEHGGFYQAVAKGFYKEKGLDVDILQGGPSTRLAETVVTGRVTFGIGRSDDTMMSISQGLPMVIVGALMQQDPQALLLHEENPINDLKDLNGTTIMTSPGSVIVQHLRARYGIDFNVLPLNYGLAQFMADKNFIQQCFVTNEPFYVRQAGAKPKTLLLSKSGYEPYRVIITSQKFARENPELVKKFVEATIQGWADYLGADPKPGNDLILTRNANMSPELLEFAVKTLNETKLVAGDPQKGERIGLITRKRLRDQLETLRTLKILPNPPSLEQVARFDLLPADLLPLVGE